MTAILERILLYLLAFAVLVGLAGAVYIEHERADKAEEQVASLSASLAASQAALGAYQASMQTATKTAATNQKKVDNALAANPDWTRTVVPDDVFDSLYGNRPHAASAVAASTVSGTGPAN